MDRILVTEKIGAEGLAALKAVAEVDVRLDLTPQTLLEALPAYDAFYRLARAGILLRHALR